jgi:hypothetical protein
VREEAKAEVVAMAGAGLVQVREVVEQVVEVMEVKVVEVRVGLVVGGQVEEVLVGLCMA